MEDLSGKTVFITGGAYRLGRLMALRSARSGADVLLHHGHSTKEAEETAREIRSLGRKCWVIQADLNDPNRVVELISEAFNLSPIYCLVNNAAVFPPGGMLETTLPTWQETLNVNLTAPFLLSQAFIQSHKKGAYGRILNILDWRALRPGRDHFAYTISKSALAALTQAAAIAGAPDITVNAIALGAILPPTNEIPSDSLLNQVPLKRWAEPLELEETFDFLLSGPSYINGEVIHLDGGRHLV